jgi:hypothetical protein
MHTKRNAIWLLHLPSAALCLAFGNCNYSSLTTIFANRCQRPTVMACSYQTRCVSQRNLLELCGGLQVDHFRDRSDGGIVEWFAQLSDNTISAHSKSLHDWMVRVEVPPGLVLILIHWISRVGCDLLHAWNSCDLPFQTVAAEHFALRAQTCIRAVRKIFCASVCRIVGAH